MGQYDSSKTRVAPLFDELRCRDGTGASWIDVLLALGSRTDIVASLPRNQRLVSNHGRRWGNNEVSLLAPGHLLAHLVRNVTEKMVEASGDLGDVREKRLALASQDQGVIDAALHAIGAGERGRKWFILEGASRPDALLETQDLVVCIEGKRKEFGCTTHTTWMTTRSQLVRHMDAATDAFPSKRVVGLLIVEGPGASEATAPSAHWAYECRKQHEQSMIDDSLPHRAPEERKKIADGILGVTTWQAACAATGVAWSSLPDKIDSMNWYNGYSPSERAAKGRERALIVSSETERGVCAMCGDPEGKQWLHSEDYSQPYVWTEPAVYRLCNPCHNRLHRRFKNHSAWKAYAELLQRGWYGREINSSLIAKMAHSKPMDDNVPIKRRNDRAESDAWWESLTLDPESLESADWRPRP